MPLTLEAVRFDAVEPAALGAFWAAVLSREVVADSDGVFLPGADTQVGLKFVEAATRKSGPNRLHLHLTSASSADQRRIVDTALRLGGRHIDVGQLPAESHVVLVDPEGNEFCVIGPGDAYLAGTGLLGEVTCDGTRAVGLFWRDALGWPLVWDRGEQTVVQSPLGGTKVAWDRWDPAPKQRDRQAFDLTTPDLVVEVGRLVALGATRLSGSDRAAELADPGGDSFRVRER